MRASLVSPAGLGPQSGNSRTALRWAAILRGLGWKTTVSNRFNGESADVMIALNAYRSAGAIREFRDLYPGRPLIVALTGTDLYRFLASDPERTREAIEAADRLVVLNTLAPDVLDPDQRAKCYMILEAAQPLPSGRKPFTRYFDVCVVGHLRDEKDSLLTAYAARDLPVSSRIRVRQYGRAHTKGWADAAQEEMDVNPRYVWFGEVPHWQIRRVLSTSRLMVVSSLIEGGPNCLSEAIVAGLPALATNIDGCVGVLGPDYPGFFSVGNVSGLRELLCRAEEDEQLLSELETYVDEIATSFTPEHESDRWAALLSDVGAGQLGVHSG